MGGIVAAIIVGALIGGALSAVTYTISTLLAPKPEDPRITSTIDRLRSMRRGNADPARVGYGRNRTSGVLFYAESVNEDGEAVDEGKVLHFGLAISHGPIEWMGKIQLNDEPAEKAEFENLVLGIPMLGEPTQKPLLGPVSMEKSDGDGGVIQQPIQFPKRWTDEQRPVSGIAYLWMILRHDPLVFRAGAPTVLVEWKGRRLYDPRLDVAESGGFMSIDDPSTWIYSTNWALVIRDFLTSRVYGMKVPNNLICSECLKTAADAADEQVEAPTAGEDESGDPITEARYTIDGIFESDEQPIDVLSRMLGAGAGALLFFASHTGNPLEQYHLRAGVAEATATWPDDPAMPIESSLMETVGVFNTPPRVSAFGVGDVVVVGQKIKLTGMGNPANDGIRTVTSIGSATEIFVAESFDTEQTTASVLLEALLQGRPIQITPDDLRDDAQLQITPQLNRKDRVNRVVGTFINPDTNFLPDRFPPVTHPTFVGKDGNLDFTQTIELPYTQSVDRARRLATIALKSARLGQRIIWPGTQRLSTLTPWSVIRVTHPHFGWDEKPFRILDRQIHETMAVDLVLSEYDDDIYDADLEPANLPDPTDLPPPFSVFPPEAVDLSVESITLQDGSRQVVIVVAITPPGSGVVEGYRIRYQYEDEGWSTANVTDPYFTIPGVRLGVYRVAVATVASGIFSSEVVTDIVVTLNLVEPPTPVDFKVTRVDDNGIELTWDMPLPAIPDLAGFRLRSLAGSNGSDLAAEWAAATPITAQIGGFSFFLAQPTEETRTYYLKAVDTAGNESVAPTFLVYTHEIVDSDLVSVRNWRLEGWPGHIASGRVNGAGELEGASSVVRWDTFATFAEYLQWGASSAGQLYWTSPILDLAGSPSGHNILASLHPTWTERNSNGAIITWRARRNEADTWGPWLPQNAVADGRYFQIRVVMPQTEEAVSPVLETFATQISTALQAFYVNDYDGQSGGFATFRVETGEGFKLGDQLKVAVGTDGSLQPEFTPALKMGGGKYVTGGPGNDLLGTMPGDWTIEIGFRWNGTDIFGGAPYYFFESFNDWRFHVGDGAVYTAPAGYLPVLFRPDVLTPGSAGTELQMNVLDDRTTWHNIAVRMRQGFLMDILYNGVVQDTKINASDISGSTDIQIGGGAGGSAGPPIVVDYARLWNRARSDDEIARDAHIRLTDEPGLIFSTNFEDGGTDDAATIILDLTSHQNNLEFPGGGADPVWKRSGVRESPPVSLNVPGLSGVSVQWEGGGEDNNAVIFVEASADSGATWEEIPTSGDAVALTLPEDPSGHTLRIRTYLESGDALNDSPFITRIVTAMGVQRVDGSIPVPVTKPFADVRTAQVVAMQGVNSGLGIQPPELISKSQLAVVFRLRDLAGNPIPTANTPEFLDVLIQGVLLPQ